MAEGAFFFYGVLATFVITSINRNKKMGRPHIKPLMIAGWALLLSSIGAATFFSLTALSMALRV